MTQMTEDLLRLLSGLIVSLLGGLVRVLRKIEKPSFTKILKELIISGFTGVMVYYLIKDVTFITESFKVFIIGMGGYSGPALLDLLEKIMLKTIEGLVKK